MGIYDALINPNAYAPNAPIDWTGSPVPKTQQFYSPISQNINGVRFLSYALNPTYDPNAVTNSNTSAPIPPHLVITFDTIGQVIYRTIGHCRLPLRVIWAQSVNHSGDTLDGATITFAAALCAPIDPDESGTIFGVWDGGEQVFNSGGVVTPLGWSATDAANLAASLSSLVLFPGDEAQLPASLIVADKGASVTNAFRGIRYIIFQNYPARSGGLPQLTLEFQRTDDGGTTDTIAVDFATGTG